MEKMYSSDPTINAMLKEQEERKKTSKQKMENVRTEEKPVKRTGEEGGALLYNSQEVPGGESALKKAKEIGRQEAVQNVSADLIGLTRSRSSEFRDPAKSKNLDNLVRHPSTGKLVRPEDLPGRR